MLTLANSEDTDEMKHSTSSGSTLFGIKDKDDLQGNAILHLYLEIIISDPPIYTMDHF